MKYLLDTHIFLWYILDDDRLDKRISDILSDKSNQFLLSIASLWEIAIKINIGKLKLNEPFQKIVPNDIKILDVSIPHLLQMIDLLWYHRDPFDRLIISQGMSEQIPIISEDRNFKLYEVISFLN